jgi:Asp/Glu/hydantoin racemase
MLPVGGVQVSSALPRRPRVGVIHAALAAVPAVEAAFRAEFPEALLRVTLDDSLILDSPDDGQIPPRLARRMERLIDFALADGLDGLLVACSSYPDVVDGFRARSHLPIPVLKADEALYTEIADRRYARVGILLTFAGAVRPARISLDGACAARGIPAPDARIRCVPEAGALLAEGQQASANQALAEAARQLCRDGAQAIVLGQYSITGAAAAVAEWTGLPVLTGPGRAAITMRRLLLGEDAAMRAGRP